MGKIITISGSPEMVHNLNIRQGERKKCGIFIAFINCLRQVFEIWWPVSFALLGHDGVDQRFRAYPVAYQSAAENLAGVPRWSKMSQDREIHQLMWSFRDLEPRSGKSFQNTSTATSSQCMTICDLRMILESLANAPSSAFQAWHVGYWFADEIMKFFVFKHFKLPLLVICCPNCGWTL